LTYLIDVVVPGPWWTRLTYRSFSLPTEGARVKVPLGRTTRTGFVTRIHKSTDQLVSQSADSGKTREIYSIIDPFPVVPPDILELSKWAGEMFFCGMGQALLAMLPKQIINGEKICDQRKASSPTILCSENSSSENVQTTFRSEYSRRKEEYVKNLKRISNGLVIFPEHKHAERFFNELPDELSERSLLWPRTAGKKLFSDWVDVLNGKSSIVIGSSSAAFAPLSRPECFIIEDESNPAYRMRMSPYLNIRSIFARRANLWGSDLILGGRLPSSRIYRKFHPSCEDEPEKKRLFFVDMKMAPKPSVPGVETPFRFSERMLEETQRSLSEHRLAIWILDRKGYAGQIFCESCGFILNCQNCGGVLTWHSEKGTLRCSICGREQTLPEACPYCKGNLLRGKRPGLEALIELSKKVLPEDINIQLWHADYPSGRKQRLSAISRLREKGLVIGSRSALSLMDELNTGLVCWLDGDVEAGKTFYNSRFSAYSMIWESLWRGKGYSDRKIVLQSRVPKRSWQRSLLTGWGDFWKYELSEREEFEVPPYFYLVEARIPQKIKYHFEETIADKGYEIFELSENSETLWIKVKSIKRFGKDISPFFHIKESGKGYPQLRLWMD